LRRTTEVTRQTERARGTLDGGMLASRSGWAGVALWLGLVACQDPVEPPPSQCGEDPPGSVDGPASTAQSQGNAFQVQLAAMSPAPPARGANTWDLWFTPWSATASVSAVRVKAWMPRHGHGTTPLWSEAAPVAGVFRVGPVGLDMAGLWEVTVEATVGDRSEQAVFRFCVADGVAPAVDAGVVADAGPPVPCNPTAPASCTEPTLSYADVEPIIAARCGSCHHGAGPQWALTSYGHVADWHNEVRGMVQGCTMPPPEARIPMTDAEREKILMWIRCGYPR
jgi:hypothetical protein